MDEAFDILGCPYQEKMDIYRVSALCMQLGRMEFQVYKNCNLSVNFDPFICRVWGRWLLQRTLTQHRPSTESASTATMKSSFTTASSTPNIRFIILSSLCNIFCPRLGQSGFVRPRMSPRSPLASAPSSRMFTDVSSVSLSTCAMPHCKSPSSSTFKYK